MNEQTRTKPLVNPFRPGAGHPPPYLAGRDAEKAAFKTLLAQEVILTNLVLTGLRGVGKTVLLDDLKPIAIQQKWMWVGTDMSESASVSEETVVCRLLADLSGSTAGIVLDREIAAKGFATSPTKEGATLDYTYLINLYQKQPGLAADKLKTVLEFVWSCIGQCGVRGIVFAYDEAQTMQDHADTNQFPLSLLLDVFQSIQRKAVPFMLVMVGLPTLFPKLVAARTYAERMFEVKTLGRLDAKNSRDAIVKPIKEKGSPLIFSDKAIANIIEASGGYPYFIQFICKETFDVYAQQWAVGARPMASLTSIIKKLDKNFFAGRWARATDRQKELLSIIARLSNCDDEFSVQDIVAESNKTEQPFSPSHINQMLVTLGDAGLTYKNRHGRYAFAVPLLGGFIRRQEAESEGVQLAFPFPDAIG